MSVWTRGWFRSHSKDGYEPLPMPPSFPSRSRGCTPRVKALLYCLFAVVLLGLWLLVYALVWHPQTWRSRLIAYVYTPNPRPPLYPEFREAEAKLPQHNVADPFAGGQKYLFASSHVFWSGWGNHMQDMVMTAHLAQLSNRTHVFNDYIWDSDGPDYTRFESKKWIPNKIPLSAIVSGPIIGNDSSVVDTIPRAISKSHFDAICPKRSVINVGDVLKAAGSFNAFELTKTYLEYISKLDDLCIEISGKAGHATFIIHAFDEVRGMMALWPSLKVSPYVTHWDWSTLAYVAFETNRHLFSPAPASLSSDREPRLDGLLVLQIRRGDFEGHCADLEGWGAGFNAYNRFKGFPDPWVFPSDADRHEVYSRRCWPSIDQIVWKVESLRQTEAGRGLRNVYVMTNGEQEWLKELKLALWQAHPWERIASSRDVVWTWEQKFVSQSMDMLVAEKAQLFIGNGFSSLASNVAMLRMAKGFVPESTTMW